MIDINTLSKSYYTIGEVAKMFRLNTSNLRYWEDEFEIISPNKNDKGERKYTKEDIENVQLVYHLVKERGLKLKAAQQMIESRKKKLKGELELISSLENIKGFLNQIKSEL